MPKAKVFEAKSILPEKEFDEETSDEPLTATPRFATGGRVSPKRVITLTESDYAQLQCLVLKYGSGTGHGSSTSITLRVAVADAEYKWS